MVSFELTDEQREIRDWVHAFAEKEIRPVAAHYDEVEEFPWPVVKKAAEVGLYGVDFLQRGWGAWGARPFTDLMTVTDATIEQVSAERLTQFEFNPRWVRIEPGATPRDQIKLVSRGQTIMIGQHLAQYRRAQFAGELRMWLTCC